MKFKKKIGPGSGALILILANLASYVLGMLRDKVFANVFGASHSIGPDSYNTAFLIPDFIYNLFIAGALGGVLMPIFVSLGKKSKKRSEDLWNSFFTIMNIFIFCIAIFAFFSCSFWVNLVFDLDQNQSETVVSLTRILLLSPILFSLSNTIQVPLLAKKHFFSIAFAPVLYNLSIVIFVYFFGIKYGITIAAWGAVFGALLHLSIRLLDFFRLGIPIRFSLDYKNKDLRRVLILSLPKAFALISLQGILWIFNHLSYKFLEKGAIASFGYARNIQSLSVSLFGIAFATSIFPFLSSAIAKNDKKDFVAMIEKVILRVLFFIIPASFGILILSNDIVKIIYQEGNFNENDTKVVSIILFFIAISIPFESLNHVISRAFLSVKNTIIPSIGQFLVFLFSVTISFIFIEKLGVKIFGISFSIASFISFLFLYTFFYFKITKINLQKIIKNLIKIIISSIFMCLTIFFYNNNFEMNNGYVDLFLKIFLGASTYFFFSFLWFKGPFISKLFKK